MMLPEICSIAPPEKCMMRFSGIDRAGTDPRFLSDAVNLTFAEGCKNRAARLHIYTADFTPDQILVCADRLFIRSGNTLREMETDDAGRPIGVKAVYPLTDLADSPDRILIIDRQALCVLPDRIRIQCTPCAWEDFGGDCSRSAALPFQNARTLFYPSGIWGDEVCEDASRFVPGLEVRFSWLGDQIFTVTQVEQGASVSELGTPVLDGTRVTLNTAVSGWNTLPTTAALQTRRPPTSPLAQAIHLGGPNNSVSFSGNNICVSSIQNKVTYTQQLANYLHVGQRIRISGASVSVNNKTAVITALQDSRITFDSEFFSGSEAKGRELILSPIIPDFNFALLLEGRLFGADNTGEEFWISRQDEPFCFYENPAEAKDAWHCSLTAKATGLAMWKDNIICFDENGAFRVLGLHALNFGLTRLPVSGIKKGCAGSLAQIGDTLFYCSARGIMKYSGGSDIRISAPLPAGLNVTCAAAAHGRYYALSEDRIWVFDPDRAVWWSESADRISRIFTFSGNRLLLRENSIYQTDGAAYAIDWSLLTAELPAETGAEVQPVSAKIELRSDAGCEISIYMKPRGGAGFEKITSQVVRGETVLRFPLKRIWCGGFQLKIEGNGECFVENITVFYRRKKQ